MLDALRESLTNFESIRNFVGVYPQSVREENNVGRTSLHVAAEYTAHSQIPFEVLQFLVEKWPEGLKVADKRGEVPLHRACYSGASLEMIQYLVERYPLPRRGQSG